MKNKDIQARNFGDQKFVNLLLAPACWVAFSGRSDSAREKEFTIHKEKKMDGKIEKGKVPSLSHSLLAPHPPPPSRFPGVPFNSPPTTAALYYLNVSNRLVVQY